MTFSGWLATLAGWYVTEIGRQPWLVTGVLTTAQAVGPVPAGSVASTLVMYLVVYAVLLVAYVTTIYRLAARGRAAESTPDSFMPTEKGAPA
jgi:cytochrome d ubiquinol oxidase subunit I